MSCLTGDRPFDRPLVKYETATGLILSPAADNSRTDLPGGYSISRKIISIEGAWSNVDVYLAVPESWVTNEVRLDLYSKGPAGRAHLQTVFCHLAGMVIDSGVATGIVLSARGAPSDGFEVDAHTTTVVAGGQVQLRVWGDQSSPDYVGNSPANGLPDFRMPSRAAHLMGYDAEEAEDPKALVWRPLLVDHDSGALIVTGAGGGAFIIAGSATPSDVYPNPTNAVTTWSLTGAYDRAAGQWERVDRGDLTNGVNPLPAASAGVGMRVESFLRGWSPSSTSWVGLNVNANGVLQVNVAGVLALADNVDYLGGFWPTNSVVLNHRNEGGNWFMSRGGYTSTIAAAATSAILNSISTLGCNTTAPTVADGEAVAAQGDTRGNLLVQIGLPALNARDDSRILYETGERSVLLHDSLAKLFAIHVACNEKTELPIYVLFLDQDTEPVDTEIPDFGFTMLPITGDEAASSYFAPLDKDRRFFSEQGKFFATGLVVCLSSTLDVVTLIPASANILITAEVLV